MRTGDQAEATRLARRLTQYERRVGALPGIATRAGRECFIEQVVESQRRTRFLRTVAESPGDGSREDPASPAFDPLRAAVRRNVDGDFDEAMWLTFLGVHFGKSRRGGWQYARAVYGRLGSRPGWTFQEVADNLVRFRSWMDDNGAAIRAQGPGRFGNHRKYESLAGSTPNGTGAAVSGYVAWAGSYGSHMRRIEHELAKAGGDPRQGFRCLYDSLAIVPRFGRTARFDYLTKASRLGLIAIEPDSLYLAGNAGPLSGARLLYGEPRATPASLDQSCGQLADFLGLGNDDLEDALCNWQKSPHTFRPFRG